MSRLNRPLPMLVFSLLLLSALFALQCPELGCIECGADEVAARQGGASIQAPAGAVVPHMVEVPLLVEEPMQSVSVQVAVTEHPALVSRLQI